MDINDIHDVLKLNEMLDVVGARDGEERVQAIESLIDWADRRNVILPPPPEPLRGPSVRVEGPPKTAPKAKGGKATESDDSVIEPSSDPSEPDF